MGDGNTDAAIGFFILIAVLAIMFARGQAKIDRIRADGAKRIADIEADHERRMDEFKTANPSASCSNCEWVEYGGRCGRGFRPRRNYCLTWSASREHEQALRYASMSDDQIVAEMRRTGGRNAEEVSCIIRDAEQYLSTGLADPIFREQAWRVLRLMRQELTRMQREEAANA